MYTYQEIISSAYFVFKEELSCHILGVLLSKLSELNISIKDKKMPEHFCFAYPYYKLKEGISIEEIRNDIKGVLVMIFGDFKCQLENQENEKKLIKK